MSNQILHTALLRKQYKSSLNRLARSGANSIGQGVGRPRLVIPEVQNLRAAAALHGLPQQLPAGGEVRHNAAPLNIFNYGLNYNGNML